MVVLDLLMLQGQQTRVVAGAVDTRENPVDQVR
jgi:hypothetical protein